MRRRKRNSEPSVDDPPDTGNCPNLRIVTLTRLATIELKRTYRVPTPYPGARKHVVGRQRHVVYDSLMPENAEQLCKYCDGPVGSTVRVTESWGADEPTRRDVYFYCKRACETSQRVDDCGHDPVQLPA